MRMQNKGLCVVRGVGMKVLTRSVWFMIGRCEADKDSADMVETMQTKDAGTGRGLAGGSTAGLDFEKVEALA